MWEYWDWSEDLLRRTRRRWRWRRGDSEEEARSSGLGDVPVAPQPSEDELLSLDASGWVARVEDVLQQRTANVRFVFDGPANMSNVWACLRTMDSFGLQYAEVIDQEDGPDPARPDLIAEVLQAQPWITVRRWPDAAACVAALRREGHILLATDLESGSVDLETVLPKLEEKMAGQSGEAGASTTKLAVVLGNELYGISGGMRRLADHRVFLAMRGMNQSFNLSATCAVLLSTFAARGLLVPGGLGEEVAADLRRLWLSAGVMRLRVSATSAAESAAERAAGIPAST